MSQYISSIIEPVVRQARRFSRTNLEPYPADERPQTSTSIDFPEYVDPLDGDVQDDVSARSVSSLSADERGSSSQVVSDNLSAPLARSGPLREASYPILESSHQNDTRGRAETDPEALASRQRHQHESLRDQFVSANASFPSSINEAGMRIMEESITSGRSSIARNSVHTSVGESELPEDDGMGNLRKKILEIQGRELSNEEKSRLMHHLMTDQYMSQAGPQIGNLRPGSPTSLRTQERPLTPTSSRSNEMAMQDSPSTSLSGAGDDLIVTLKDIEPTYYVPQAIPGLANKNLESEEKEAMSFGCSHYKRNVKLQCSACRRWYTCRFCHDSQEDHCLNRPATKNMLCMFCGCAQAATTNCKNCGRLAAWYYCKICKLWDDDVNKKIYHCHGCGICRRGEGLGKDFFHCEKCGACISMKIKDSHKCIERSTDCDCPICGEYMFTSPKTVVFMRCGHSIHETCWKEHMKNSYKCPICSKSMINMDLTFRTYDEDIRAQPMPPSFRDTKAWISCNDCNAKSLVMYHWIGLKCTACDSYNTTRLQILSAPGNNDGGSSDREQSLEGLHESSLRGRAESGGTQIRATSVSALIPPRSTMVPPRNAHSTSPRSMGRFVFPPQNDTESSDAMDTADEDDEVDFWGGESPRDRAFQARIEAEVESMSESEEDSLDDYDDIMDEDDDDDDEDIMEIFGHR